MEAGMKSSRSTIDNFFSAKAYAVIGASEDHKKFGNMVFHAMKEREMVVYPVNPNREKVEGCKCFSSVLELPGEVTSIVTIVRPAATERVIQDCAKKNIKVVWMQPGSESRSAKDEAEAGRMIVVSGRCIMMFLDPVLSVHAVHRWFNKIIGVYPG